MTFCLERSRCKFGTAFSTRLWAGTDLDNFLLEVFLRYTRHTNHGHSGPRNDFPSATASLLLLFAELLPLPTSKVCSILADSSVQRRLRGRSSRKHTLYEQCLCQEGASVTCRKTAICYSLLLRMAVLGCGLPCSKHDVQKGRGIWKSWMRGPTGLFSKQCVAEHLENLLIIRGTFTGGLCVVATLLFRLYAVFLNSQQKVRSGSKAVNSFTGTLQGLGTHSCISRVPLRVLQDRPV